MYFIDYITASFINVTSKIVKNMKPIAGMNFKELFFNGYFPLKVITTIFEFDIFTLKSLTKIL